MPTGAYTTVGDPAGNLDAFGERRGAHIGHPGIGADHPAGADEQRLAPGPFHDPGVRCGRRMQNRQHLVAATIELKRRPQLSIDGKYSIPFTTAVMMVRGNVTLRDYTHDGLAPGAAERVIELVHDLDRLEDVTEILSAIG
jgi:hypothetical protein